MSTNQLNPIKLYSGPFTPMQSKHPPSQDKEPMWEFYQIQDTLTESLGDKGQKNVLSNYSSQILQSGARMVECITAHS